MGYCHFHTSLNLREPKHGRRGILSLSGVSFSTVESAEMEKDLTRRCNCSILKMHDGKSFGNKIIIKEMALCISGASTFHKSNKCIQGNTFKKECFPHQKAQLGIGTGG